MGFGRGDDAPAPNAPEAQDRAEDQQQSSQQDDQDLMRLRRQIIKDVQHRTGERLTQYHIDESPDKGRSRRNR